MFSILGACIPQNSPNPLSFNSIISAVHKSYIALPISHEKAPSIANKLNRVAHI